jgi:hypothetical protein
VLITVLGLWVPADHWGSSPWRWILLSLVVCALAGLTVVLAVQSKDDYERDAKEKNRDMAQETLLTQVAQLAARGDEKSLMVTRTTLSELSPGVEFKFDDYFRTGHASQLTEQTAKDMKILVGQQHPNDREEALARFIGMGFWGYLHEVTWAYIFRSQILALTDLNAKGGVLSLTAITSHFEKATTDFPNTYALYTFNQWMDFMLTHSLLIRKPGDVVEITVRGRDFLKFLTHWGWTADMKRN